MLRIYTKKLNNTITNIEALFVVRYNEIKIKYLKNTHILELLRKIEGMVSYHGEVLIAKYGAVPLSDVSMGAKASILAILYSGEFIISTDEMGYNCLFELVNVSKEEQINVYSSVPYMDFPEGIDVYIDNYLCSTRDEVIETMEALYE